MNNLLSLLMGRAIIAAVLCFCLGETFLPASAHAAHHRFSHVHWSPGSNPNEINFVIQNAWTFGFAQCRNPNNPSQFGSAFCSAGSLPGIGDIVTIQPGSAFLFGDGTQYNLPGAPSPVYVVTDVFPSMNFFVGRVIDHTQLPNIVTTVTKTYNQPGNYIASLQGCCRLGHVNNSSAGYRIQTTVNVGTGNASPISLVPVVVNCPINGLCTFPITALDPNNDTLHFRFSTPQEATGGASFNQPGPPQAPNAAAVDPDTGWYTWDTTGATIGNGLYSTHVTIEDLDDNGNVKSAVAVDFLIQLVTQVGTPPAYTQGPCGQTITVNLGSSLNFDVEAEDTDAGDTVTLSVIGLPTGATMTPPLPTSGNPVNSSFSWTPNASHLGSHILIFTAQDQTGQAAPLCPVTINVENFQPPDVVCDAYPSSGGFTVVNDVIVVTADSDAGREVTLDGSGTTDPANLALDYEWEVNGVLVGNTATLDITLPVGLHEAILTVTNSAGESDSCTVWIEVIALPPDAVCDATAVGSSSQVIAGVLVIEAAGDSGATVALDGSGSSDPGNLTLDYEWDLNGNVISSDPSVNVLLAIGQHQAVLTVTNSAGETHTCTVEIEVIAYPPVAVCDVVGGFVFECDSMGTAEVTLDGSGSFDPLGLSFDVMWSVGGGVVLDDPTSAVTSGAFPLGVHTATLTIENSAGLVDFCDVIITVQDTTPPEVFITTDLAVLWPPNHTMRDVQVIVTATDNCEDCMVVFPLAVWLTSSEPDNAQGNGDGNTTGDCHGFDGFTAPVNVTSAFTWDPNYGDKGAWIGTIQVRAERAGSGNGRTYTLEVQALDGSLNIGASSVTIFVPKSQGNN